MKEIHFESLLAVCPYYKRHGENRICCEGESAANRFNVVFDSTNHRDAYAKSRCNSTSGCRKCLIHQALNIKYGVI